MALKIGSTSVSKMYKGSIEITKGYLGSTLIYSSVAPTVALNDSNFYTARDLWFTDQAQAETTYGLIGDWNTTAVTTLSSAFYGGTGVVTSGFNEDISGWDVSNVIDMSNVVRAQPLFNQPIGAWDTSSVAKFIYCFYSATGFDQDMSNWNILSSWTVLGMFNGVNLSTVNYDLLLVSWEAQLQGAYPNGAGYSSRVIQFGGGSQYTGFGAGGAARASLVNTFNWTFTDGGDVAALTNSNFNTVRDLWFTNQSQAETSYGLIGQWNTTAVTNMSNAFSYAGVVTNDFNEDISGWDMSNVTNMSGMFYRQPLFNQDLSSWDTSNVNNISSIFWKASAFNQPLNSWDVSNVNNMSFSLRETSVFNQDLSSWDTSNVTSMRSIFYKSYLFDQNISSWNVNKVSNLSSFLTDVSLSLANYNALLVGWEATLQASFPNGAGYTLTPTVTFGLSEYRGSGQAGVSRASLISNFNWTIVDGGDIEALTNSSLGTAIDLWFTNQSQAEATYGLIGDWNTTGVTSMNNAFKVANNVTNGFNEDISGWDTSNVTSTYAMFFDQTSFNQPIGSWDVSSVTAASNMFRSCESFNQPLNSWNTSSFADINSLFFRCLVFNQPLNSWDTSNVTNLATTFYGAFDFNQDLSSWNTGSVTSLFYTFRTASSFNQNLGSWDITNVSTLSNIFKDTALDTSNYDLMLIAWESSLQTQFPNGAGYLKIPAADFGSTKYTGGGSAATARASLVSNFNWTITDGGIA